MITMYTRPGCTLCEKAKNMLDVMNVKYNNFTVGSDVTREFIISSFPTAKTYPVIVINGEYIGGYTELEQRINEQKDNFNKMFLTE